MKTLLRRAAKETLHLLLDLPVGIAGFTIAVTGLATSAGLLVTFLGVPLLAGTLLLARLGAQAERFRARVLLDLDVPAPHPLVWPAGALGRVLAPFRDGASWRATLYFLLMLPVGIATFSVALGWWC